MCNILLKGVNELMKKKTVINIAWTLICVMVMLSPVTALAVHSDESVNGLHIKDNSQITDKIADDKEKLQAVNFGEVAEPEFDPEKGNKLPITGYYEQNIISDNVKDRTAKIYIPKNARMREYFIVLALESGTDIDSFLTESGWRDIADDNNVCLMALVPGSNGWGDYNSEEPYLDEVLNKAGSSRTWYSIFSTHYIVGYGDGGDVLQTWAAKNPLFVISQVYFNSNIKADVLKKAGKEEYGETTDNNGNVVDTTMFENVSKHDVPVPTWFIGVNIKSAVISYWKDVNDCFKNGKTDSKLMGSIVYNQDKKNSNAIATSFSDVVSEVAVLTKSLEYKDITVSQNVYNFLSKYTRYDNTSVYGNVLGERADYEKIGVETNYLYLYDDFGQKWTREYLAYVPKNSQELWPDGAPAVYVFSGSTQPDNLFFDSSHWWEVADKYGFILIVPCSTGTITSVFNSGENSKIKPNDVVFTEAVIDDVNSKYHTDPNRVYVTGQSAGCMFTQHLAMTIPEKVTVFGGTSGPIMGDSAVTEGVSSDITPYYTIFGEYDYWPWKVGKLYDSDFMGTMGSKEAGNTLYTQNYWLNRNQLGSINDFEITHDRNLKKAKDVSIGYIVNPNSSKYKGDRYKTYSWKNDDGIPLFVWTQCAGRSHNNVVSDAWRLWEDWFSKWTRDGNILHYSESGFKVKEDIKTLKTKKGLVDGVVSTKAITDSLAMGQKLAAVVVEYVDNVNSSNLDLNSYSVKDLYYDGAMKEAVITNIYTNNAPKMRNDKKSVEGRYVIIETDPFDRVGYMVSTYKDPQKDEEEEYWLKPDVNTVVRQECSIINTSGSNISKENITWMKMTSKTKHLKFEDLKKMTIKSKTNKDAQGNPLDILFWYYLPEGYEQSTVKYPVVFVESGTGLRYWEKENSLGDMINNAGACVAFDQSATAWIKNDYEDVIVVGVNYRGDYAPENYDATPDINQTARYFIDNFKVDSKRLYFSGNSAGSVLGYKAINQSPELWAAFMPCNGLYPTVFEDLDSAEKIKEYEDGIKDIMTPLAKEKVAVIWQLGYDDAGASGFKGQMFYDFMYDYYKNEGMTDEQINKILRLNLYYKQDYYDNNVLTDDNKYNPHLATKLVYSTKRDNFMPWILNQINNN